MFLLAALSLGFLGSFHCIGMCGPIALSIPVNRKSFFSLIAGTLTYNSGRLITYSLMGLVFGLVGEGFVLAGLQQSLSVFLGIGIIILLLIPRISQKLAHSGQVIRFIEKWKSVIRKLFGIHSYSSLLLIGLLNGLLPCGLVYLGIAGSVATGDPIDGALFMAAFGLGTLPAMLSITFLRDLISIRIRKTMRKIVPVFVVITAVLLILRGLNLGIPYVSPSIRVVDKTCQMDCCAEK